MDLKELSSRELGEYFEWLFVAKLIKLGFEVFVPVIDKGIDFIVRKEYGGIAKYFEVQVKAVRTRGGRLTVGRSIFSPNVKNRFLAFFRVAPDESYKAFLIPSRAVCEIFRPQTQKGKPIYRLYTSKGDLEKIREYEWDVDSTPEAWKG